MALQPELLNPIAGDNPGGTEVRYEPVFDEIKEARREEDDLPQGDWETKRKVADFTTVIKLATDVLSKQSKDLQVAAWLTEALTKRDGFPGLIDGLELLRGLIDKFWDHLHPAIEDEDDIELRAAPLEWIDLNLETPAKMIGINSSGHDFLQYKESRLVGYEDDVAGDSGKKAARDAALADGKLAPEDFDSAFDGTPKAWYKALAADIKASLEAIKALDDLCGEKFGHAAPSFRKLQNAVIEVQRVTDQFLAKKLELDPDPVEERFDEDSGEEAGVSGAAGAGGGGASTLSLEPTSRDDAAARVASAARYLQQDDPRNPASYLMLRGFRWGELRSKGSQVDPKMLSAPPTSIRTKLKGLLLDGKWPELLSTAEMLMATPHGRGWLDLQRYVLTACEMMGSEYEFVSDAIKGALAALLRDLPDLPDQTLMDDTPTANVETRAWLRDLNLAELAPDTTADGEATVSADQRRKPSRSVYDRAMDAVRAGSPQRGIEMLMKAVNEEKSERGRFLRQAQVAGIMVEHGMEAVAMPMLNELMQEIEEHKLEDWEAGGTVARPMGLLYRCLNNLQGETAESHELYLRICRLDPLQAIGFTNRNDGGAVAAAPDPTEAAATEGDGAEGG